MAMIVVAASLLLSRLGSSGSNAGLAALVAAAILLDFGVTAHFVFGQRAIFSLGAEFCGRLNGLYMATFFAGGAVGSALGGWAYADGGWSLSMWVGLSLPTLALGFHLGEWKSKSGQLEDERAQNGGADVSSLERALSQ
jgi:predicted MFS family arabinose efflux permease